MKTTGHNPNPIRPNKLADAATFRLRLSVSIVATASVTGGIVAGAEPAGASGQAGSVAPSATVAEGAAKQPSLYDRIWGYATLYNNPTNPLVQSIQFTGRYQLDYTVIDDDDYDKFNNRRWRMGAKAQVFQNFTLHAEAELDHDEDPFYQRLTDAYLKWSAQDYLQFTAGKHGALFTMDGQTSSKELLAIDRSNLSNNMWFPEEYIPGVSAGGKVDPWLYNVGIFSSGSASKEFGNFDGKYFILSSIGYDFSKAMEAKDALLTANYVYQDPDELNEFTRQLRHVGSLNFKYEKNRWGVRTDLTGAIGYLGQSDLWGFMVMPFYNITKALQAVTRYTYIASEDDNGVRFARYENEVEPGRGDEYHEIYAGLNYYFYNHKLKIQSGVQYADMDDDANNGGQYRGWAWTTGLRISW